MMDTWILPAEVTALCCALQQAGHRALLVGGAVRDHLRLPEGQAVPKDYDLATSARPEEVTALLAPHHRLVLTGVQHGTVVVLCERPGMAPAPVEVTTFRGEGAYSDGRRPDQVAFLGHLPEGLREDLRRRDFTINAMAYDPIADVLEDPFHGQRDLERRLLRAVGDAAARFAEDGLRTMRAVRFAAQLGFALDPDTAAAIPGALPTFRKVSGERVRDELLKLLAAPEAPRGLHLLRETGLLGEILPELSGDLPLAVFQTLCGAVAALPPDAILRLGALLAPLAPGGLLSSAPLLPLPAEALAALLGRLKLSAREQARITHVLSTPPPRYDASWSDAALRRYLAATPAPLREDQERLLRVLAADAPAWEAPDGLGSLYRRAAAELSRRPALSMGELALSGKEVMERLGIPPGPRVGLLLRDLLERVLDDPSRNSKERLEQVLRELSPGQG